MRLIFFIRKTINTFNLMGELLVYLWATFMKHLLNLCNFVALHQLLKICEYVGPSILKYKSCHAKASMILGWKSRVMIIFLCRQSQVPWTNMLESIIMIITNIKHTNSYFFLVSIRVWVHDHIFLMTSIQGTPNLFEPIQFTICITSRYYKVA